MQLNPEQEQVAEHVRGRILTLAGPGSGKTKTLTERTGRLIRKGVEPAAILCLTFTNKARDEMRERIAAVHGAMAQKVFISNFHGLCGTVLRRFGGGLGYDSRLTVCDADDQVDLILQIARKRGLEPTKPAARVMALVANDWRENLGTPDDLEALADGRLSSAETGVVRRYVEALRFRNQCDFSGLLSETVRLLQEHADVRDRLRGRWKFIQVDEYQDTNRAQNQIVELLAGDEDNLLAVGDADQSIYAWRGASPEAIPQFIRNGEKKTGSCRIVKLGVNYRSTPQIVACADTLIRHGPDRIAVEFSTIRPPGEPVKCVAFDKPEDEAEGIAESIKNLIRTDGMQAREIAVFYRTNDMSRPIEQALAKRQVAYTVIGSGSYYDRMEVKDVLSMLRFLCNPKDGISFHRIANKPARGMGDALVGKLEAFAERINVDLLQAMRRASEITDDHGKPLSESAVGACRAVLDIFGFPIAGRSVASVVNEVLDRSRYDQWLKDRYEDKGEYEQRARNVVELVNSMAQFSEAHPRASVGDYLQSISLYTDADARDDDNAVRLMSLHASKGLEFDVVFMVGVEHHLLPHEKAVKDRGEAGLHEERRLCYVGFTRARKVLRVTWCRMRQDVFARSKTAVFRPSLPSRFLLEAGLVSGEHYQEAVASVREHQRAALRRGGRPQPKPTKQAKKKPANRRSTPASGRSKPA